MSENIFNTSDMKNEAINLASLHDIYTNPIINDVYLESIIDDINNGDFLKTTYIISRRFNDIVSDVFMKKEESPYYKLFFNTFFYYALVCIVENPEVFDNHYLHYNKFALYSIIANTVRNIYGIGMEIENKQEMLQCIENFVVSYDKEEYKRVYEVYQDKEITTHCIIFRYSSPILSESYQQTIWFITNMIEPEKMSEESKLNMLSCLYSYDNFGELFFILMTQKSYSKKNPAVHNQRLVFDYTIKMIETLPSEQIRFILIPYVENMKLYGKINFDLYEDIDKVINKETPNLLEARDYLEKIGYEF